MPSYKTHAIHGEIVLSKIDKKVEIKKEDLKVFCFGPDTLIPTDYDLFIYQHRHKVKVYFESILKLIKENKLQDNSEVMAFLYGQLDHYVLDICCHPLIYYMTESIPKSARISPHGLVEMWIDDYIMEKYGKKELLYFRKWYLKDKDLRMLIDNVYKQVYNSKHKSLNYSFGIFSINFLDLMRSNSMSSKLLKMFNIGDISYKGQDRALPYLNLNRELWTNPITGEEYTSTFDDLWEKSIETSLESIQDVNRYLYLDKPFFNKYISADTAFNTGFPCEQKTSFKFVKKY